VSLVKFRALMSVLTVLYWLECWKLTWTRQTHRSS